MNRLAGMKAYLAGAMGKAHDGGEGWRNDITPWLQDRGVFVMNPCDKPIENSGNEAEGRRIMNEWKHNGEYHKIRPAYGESIRGIDLRMVDESSFIIANVDMSINAVGTWEEVTTANREKKPIIIHVEQGKEALSNWAFLMLPHQLVFSTWDEIKAYLDDIHTGRNNETLNRWRFFDWARMVRETTARYGQF